MLFGPDTYLYLAFGDGTSTSTSTFISFPLIHLRPLGGPFNDPRNRGQSMDTLLGKVLRIDVDSTPDTDLNYHIPLDNPFQATPGAWGEIWAHGFRNPWSCSFDRVTERLICGDVGEALAEEIKYDLAPFSPMHLFSQHHSERTKLRLGQVGRKLQSYNYRPDRASCVCCHRVHARRCWWKCGCNCWTLFPRYDSNGTHRQVPSCRS